jgi:hypothetical protein
MKQCYQQWLQYSTYGNCGVCTHVSVLKNELIQNELPWVCEATFLQACPSFRIFLEVNAGFEVFTVVVIEVLSSGVLLC